ncbi:DUF6745 domain-containing protein [Kibdelosporangium persicum]|uniref:Membrane protein n=1 Tax=Kibdelosporangium persicum TaxID=2698649 RepID=A0ABX2F1V4_9PSEU|nr:hypothetical protein [Kibdelosporangium persicum]NRN65314.1 putative membrane protein [Kibdelosporangium persicum]
MSAARRRKSRLADKPLPSVEFWWRAVDIRDEWSAHALSCEPADRETTQTTITSLYALAGAPPPQFVWVDSPSAAADQVPPSDPLRHNGSWPLESRIATRVSALRERLDRRIGRYRPVEVPNPSRAVAGDQPAKSILDPCVRGALRRSIRESVADMIRAADSRPSGLRWLGQHDVDWIAHYDMHQRVLETRFADEDLAELELWATLARSCGWWWPREDRCFVAERPLVLRTDPETRLHCADGPAVIYPDGWKVHAWHGTLVPAWVTGTPTADMITAERNVEVRRCAIEKIGWPAFIDQAGSTLLGQAPDPGNPGCELRLYALPATRTRLLLATNGSLERDGTRRQYGLHVPDRFDNPVDAAGWTYGLTGAQYAQLRRRT